MLSRQELSRLELRSSRSRLLHKESEPRGSKVGRGSSLTYEMESITALEQGRSSDGHPVQPRVQIITEDHGDDAGGRASRTSNQQSGCGSVRNAASHSLVQQVGNDLSVTVAPKRSEEAGLEASCSFLKILREMNVCCPALSTIIKGESLLQTVCSTLLQPWGWWKGSPLLLPLAMPHHILTGQAGHGTVKMPFWAARVHLCARVLESATPVPAGSLGSALGRLLPQG